MLHGGGRAPLCLQAALMRFGSPEEQPLTPHQTFFFLLHMVWLDCNPQRWGQTEKTFRGQSVWAGTAWVPLHSCFSFRAALGFNLSSRGEFLSPVPLPRWCKCLLFTPDVGFEIRFP